MATIYVAAKVNGVDYGALGSGPGGTDLGIVSFGAYAAGPASHFDIQNIKVGTSGYGSSDLFAPVLNDLSEFDGIYGNDGSIVAAAGILSVDAATSSDHYAWKRFAGPPATIYVEFELRTRSGDTNSDYQDVWSASADPSTDTGADDGIYNGGAHWGWDGPGTFFGTGPTGSPTWDTLDLYYSYAGPVPPPATPFHIAS